MDGWEGRIVLEGKERDQTEEIRKQCQGGFRYGNKTKKKSTLMHWILPNKEMS